MNVDEISKRDSIADIALVYTELQKIIDTRRSNVEYFVNFQARFAAHVSKVYALRSSMELSEAISDRIASNSSKLRLC